MIFTLAPPALPRDRDGYEYGSATQLAALLNSPERPITPGAIRNWAYRSRKPGDRFHGRLPAVHISGRRTGHTFYRLLDAARLAAMIEAGVR